MISIHALLAESDRIPGPAGQHGLDFYPRSPCGERPSPPTAVICQFDFYPRSPCGERPTKSGTFGRSLYFYPRSPCGERHWPRVMVSPTLYFYPRSPCGERHSAVYNSHCKVLISIHALLAESDRKYLFLEAVSMVFLSTLSLRRATCQLMVRSFISRISIHALLAESDSTKMRRWESLRLFLSTLSLRRATY